MHASIACKWQGVIRATAYNNTPLTTPSKHFRLKVRLDQRCLSGSEQGPTDPNRKAGKEPTRLSWLLQINADEPSRLAAIKWLRQAVGSRAEVLAKIDRHRQEKSTYRAPPP
ncbi:hypothetical protein [Variovorax sp. RA8]|uniref:hypothetical protein n=1 Tax=Variovorax sp. (strain JCM 16519 / RA8) TaxID=662548 RepID=UPI0013A59863|nr:hypothetical protein [Variovorax sp. RA8]